MVHSSGPHVEILCERSSKFGIFLTGDANGERGQGATNSLGDANGERGQGATNSLGDANGEQGQGATNSLDDANGELGQGATNSLDDANGERGQGATNSLDDANGERGAWARGTAHHHRVHRVRPDGPQRDAVRRLLRRGGQRRLREGRQGALRRRASLPAGEPNPNPNPNPNPYPAPLVSSRRRA
jgi:hypothetical protein